MDSLEMGKKLKEFREQKQLTLKELADLSGLSVGFISQVERGQTDPSLASLKKLVAALEVSLKELFDQKTYSCIAVKRGKGALMEISSKVQCHLLAPSLEKMMEPTIKYIQPGGGSGMVDGHPGEEFVWMCKGTLEISVGDNIYILEEGDSVYYQASQNHAWRNTSDEPCMALWIMTPPSYS